MKRNWKQHTAFQAKYEPFICRNFPYVNCCHLILTGINQAKTSYLTLCTVLWILQLKLSDQWFELLNRSLWYCSSSIIRSKEFFTSTCFSLVEYVTGMGYHSFHCRDTAEIVIGDKSSNRKGRLEWLSIRVFFILNVTTIKKNSFKIFWENSTVSANYSTLYTRKCSGLLVSWGLLKPFMNFRK